MLKASGKKVSRAGIDAFVTAQIRKSDKAPANFSRMRGLAKDTASDLKVKGKSLKIPWGLVLFVVPVLIIIYLIITRRKRPEFDEGVGEPTSLRGKDVKTLLRDFFFKDKGKVTGEPGRPFDEEV